MTHEYYIIIFDGYKWDLYNQQGKIQSEIYKLLKEIKEKHPDWKYRVLVY